MSVSVVIGLFAFATAIPVAAQDRGAAPAAEEKICRTPKLATGSRLKQRKICRTQAEWDRLDAQETDASRLKGPHQGSLRP